MLTEQLAAHRDPTERLLHQGWCSDLCCLAARCVMPGAGIIKLAVRSCLAQCAQARFPLTSLSDYAEKLRGHGWDEPSIEVFERQVLVSLAENTKDERQTRRRKVD